MCIVKAIYDFAVTGVKTFRQAVLGEYDEESKEVRQLKDEMMNHTSGFATDRKKLRNDRRFIYGDMRKSYNNILLGNV